MTLEGIEIELDRTTIRTGDLRVFQVDRQDGVEPREASSKSFSRFSGLTLIGRMPFF